MVRNLHVILGSKKDINPQIPSFKLANHNFMAIAIEDICAAHGFNKAIFALQPQQFQFISIFFRKSCLGV